MPSPQIVEQMVGDVKFPPEHLNPNVELWQVLRHPPRPPSSQVSFP